MTGIEMIAAERKRQCEVEGWTAEHDREHENGELAMAACCYAAPRPIQSEMWVDGHDVKADPWPWDSKWDKRGKHCRLRQLQIAGALIAAEIDRLISEGTGQSCTAAERKKS